MMHATVQAGTLPGYAPFVRFDARVPCYLLDKVLEDLENRLFRGSPTHARSLSLRESSSDSATSTQTHIRRVLRTEIQTQSQYPPDAVGSFVSGPDALLEIPPSLVSRGVVAGVKPTRVISR